EAEAGRLWYGAAEEDPWRRWPASSSRTRHREGTHAGWSPGVLPRTAPGSRSGVPSCLRTWRGGGTGSRGRQRDDPMVGISVGRRPVDDTVRDAEMVAGELRRLSSAHKAQDQAAGLVGDPTGPGGDRRTHRPPE